MNCDRGENVSSYFKLEPQTQNKQIKNANEFSAEQMLPQDPGCFITWYVSGETCQSIYFKTCLTVIFDTSVDTPWNMMGYLLPIFSSISCELD